MTQKFPHDDFEILLILNGEKNPYFEMIEEIVSDCLDKEINITILYSPSAGVSNARNLGLEKAKGEYITFVDDDDYVSPSYLEDLYKYAGKETISIAHPLAFNEGGIINDYSIEKEYMKIDGEKSVSYLKVIRIFQGPCMKLFHRDIIGERRFDKSFKNGEDALFMFLISDKFKFVKATTEEAIYYRRVRMDGAAYSTKPLSYKINNSLRLIIAYGKIYFTHPFSYSFKFFITRILGAVKMCLK